MSDLQETIPRYNAGRIRFTETGTYKLKFVVDGTDVVYAPPVGFEGVDSYTYRLRGRFGGGDSGTVTCCVVKDGHLKEKRWQGRKWVAHSRCDADRHDLAGRRSSTVR